MVTMVMGGGGGGEAKNGIFARKTLGTKDLKLGIHIQLHSGSSIGWVPPGHTTFFSCVG